MSDDNYSGYERRSQPWGHLMTYTLLSRQDWGARTPRAVDTNFGGVDTLTS